MNLSGRSPASREKRLDTLSAYLGETSALLKEYESTEVDQRIRTFSQSTPDDVLSALKLLAGFRDAMTIIHGPRGCAASSVQLALAPAQEGRRGRWIVTNLNQRETIMGSDNKLRETVKANYSRYAPKAIFIVATPAVSINNDDIQSVANELSDELGVPIIPAYTSGFASKASVHGNDVAAHSLIKQLLPSTRGERGEHVNLLSTTELASDCHEAERLLVALGLESNTLPNATSIEVFRRAAEARLSVPLDYEATTYLGNALQELAQVPYLTLPRPIGVVATKQWLSGIGAATDRVQEALHLHIRETVAATAILQSSPLRGVRVYLSLSPSTALGVLDLVQELGGEIVGITVEHLDRLSLEGLRHYQQKASALHIHIGHGQGFEEVNLLRRIKPGLYVGSGSHITQIAQLGIPSLYLPRIPIIGYRGVVSFAREASKVLRNQSFVANLAKQDSVYLASWLQRSPNWHIKQEVK